VGASDGTILGAAVGKDETCVGAVVGALMAVSVIDKMDTSDKLTPLITCAAALRSDSSAALNESTSALRTGTRVKEASHA
jgi:hypothetical protein